MITTTILSIFLFYWQYSFKNFIFSSFDDDHVSTGWRLEKEIEVVLNWQIENLNTSSSIVLVKDTAEVVKREIKRDVNLISTTVSTVVPLGVDSKITNIKIITLWSSWGNYIESLVWGWKTVQIATLNLKDSVNITYSDSTTETIPLLSLAGITFTVDFWKWYVKEYKIY